MKKHLLILVLCLVSVCCLYGCKQKESKKEQETATTQTTEFEKPDDYATIITVSINPVFNLYLDENNEVLAIEPVNDDAKSIIGEIKCENKNVDAIVKEIVKCTDETGFLKKDATVDIKVTETTISEEAQADLIATIEDEMTKDFKQVKVNVAIALEDKKQGTEKEEKKESDSDAPEDKKQVAQKEEKKESDSNKTTTHTHKYSDATCTKPQTCSCGATKGSALGHNYVEGVCTRCKEKDPNFKYPSLASMGGRWKLQFISNLNNNWVTIIDFYFSTTVTGELYDYGDMPSEPGGVCCKGENKERNCIIWNNKHYTCGGGYWPVDKCDFSETGNSITIYDNEGKKMVLQRTSSNTMKVVSIENGFAQDNRIPLGTVLTFENVNYKPFF